MSDDNGVLTAHLAEHPRLIGALFTILLLLSKAGSAAAGNQVSTIG